MVSHEVCGEGCFLGDWQVGCACGNNADGSRPLAERDGFDREATCCHVMSRLRQTTSQGNGVILRNPRCQDSAIRLENPLGDGRQLIRGLACPEYDFREALSQGSVGIDHRESQVHIGWGLESSENFISRDFAGMESVKQRSGLGRRHVGGS